MTSSDWSVKTSTRAPVRFALQHKLHMDPGLMSQRKHSSRGVSDLGYSPLKYIYLS